MILFCLFLPRCMITYFKDFHLHFKPADYALLHSYTYSNSTLIGTSLRQVCIKLPNVASQATPSGGGAGRFDNLSSRAAPAVPGTFVLYNYARLSSLLRKHQRLVQQGKQQIGRELGRGQMLAEELWSACQMSELSSVCLYKQGLHCDSKFCYFGKKWGKKSVCVCFSL